MFLLYPLSDSSASISGSACLPCGWGITTLAIPLSLAEQEELIRRAETLERCGIPFPTLSENLTLYFPPFISGEETPSMKQRKKPLPWITTLCGGVGVSQLIPSIKRCAPF